MIRELMHRRYQRALERLFIQGMPAPRHSKLRAHIQGCSHCRALYEGERRLEDALYATGGIAPSAMERLADLVVLDAAPRERYGSHPLLWSVVATTAVLLAVLVVGRLAPGPREELTARGVATPPRPAALSVFLVDPAHHEVAALARTETATAVKRGSVLQLAYSNSHFKHLAVVGWDSELSLHWYYPTDATGNRSLRTNVSEEPMGRAFEVVGAPGPLRLFAIFDDAPIAKAQLEDAFRDLRRSGVGPILLDELVGIGAAVDTVLLDVQP